jgi:hypothetical protein
VPVLLRAIRAARIAVCLVHYHITPGRNPSNNDKPPNGEMTDELDDIQADVLNGQSTQIERDEAFCARMRWAIEAGLENAPIGVVTTPGTNSSPRDMEHA